MQNFSNIELIVFFIYIVVASYGFYIYSKKTALQGKSEDYFLAAGSLTWGAIGASVIASNISAEQSSACQDPALH